MRITDSHNHLHFHSFKKDLATVVDRALASGIEKMLLVGIDPQDSKKALEVSRMNQGMLVSVGIHPQKADVYASTEVLALADLASDSKVVAIGETGFDLYRTPESKELQRKLFVAHIELARSLPLPLVIHDRDAHRETLAALDSEDAWSLGGVFHCFSGDVRMASRILENGFFISIPGVVTYNKASTLREVVQMCPLESLLVETDAPFLSPEPFRGKRNEPSYLVKTLEEIARIKGFPPDIIAQKTAENFDRLFPVRRSGY